MFLRCKCGRKCLMFLCVSSPSFLDSNKGFVLDFWIDSEGRKGGSLPHCCSNCLQLQTKIWVYVCIYKFEVWIWMIPSNQTDVTSLWSYIRICFYHSVWFLYVHSFNCLNRVVKPTLVRLIPSSSVWSYSWTAGPTNLMFHLIQTQNDNSLRHL